MSVPAKLPEKIKNDISIYLAPEEKLLKAITSTASNQQSSGQVWLILTSNSIFFHTCQTGKEPVVALLERKEIKEIEYFQRSREIVLTFVPARNPQKITRLSFAMEKRDELEDFCDDLADLINFKKETAVGIKTFAVPPSEVPVSEPAGDKKIPVNSARHKEPEIRHVTSATRHSENVEPSPKQEIITTPVTPSEARPPEVKIVNQTARLASSSLTSSSEGFKASYVVIATIVSILVAFLWYQFFKSLSDTR